MTLLRTGKVQGEVAAAIYDPSRITDYWLCHKTKHSTDEMYDDMCI